MFGSKQLLIAFLIGSLGLGLTSSVAFSQFEGSQSVLFLFGLLLI